MRTLFVPLHVNVVCLPVHSFAPLFHLPLFSLKKRLIVYHVLAQFVVLCFPLAVLATALTNAGVKLIAALPPRVFAAIRP